MLLGAGDVARCDDASGHARIVRIGERVAAHDADGPDVRIVLFDAPRELAHGAHGAVGRARPCRGPEHGIGLRHDARPNAGRKRTRQQLEPTAPPHRRRRSADFRGSPPGRRQSAPSCGVKFACRSNTAKSGRSFAPGSARYVRAGRLRDRPDPVVTIAPWSASQMPSIPSASAGRASPANRRPESLEHGVVDGARWHRHGLQRRDHGPAVAFRDW